jgi:hypothetical protein
MRRNAGFRLLSVALAAIVAGLDSGMTEINWKAATKEMRRNRRLQNSTKSKLKDEMSGRTQAMWNAMARSGAQNHLGTPLWTHRDVFMTAMLLHLLN